MKKFKILIPCYNDWKSLFKLLNNIDNNITMFDAEFTVLIVNDCSTEKMPKPSFDFKKIKSVDLINIKNNQGHTRCNATSRSILARLKSVFFCCAIIIAWSALEGRLNSGIKSKSTSSGAVVPIIF